jgi:hypothetical protein
MRGTTKVAGQHLARSALSPDEQHALLGLHGRASARLAWMLLCRLHIKESVSILARAVQLNRLFPLLVPIWIAQRALRRGRLFP